MRLRPRSSAPSTHRSCQLTWPFASKQEVVTDLTLHKMIGSGGEWRIRHDGCEENIYQTKEYP
jgi:hypothetical protein